MRISIQRGETAIQRGIFEPLARSLAGLGHSVWQVENGAEVVDDLGAAFVWGGRPVPGVPTFCVENGWLPRWEYQIGLGGINARHHAAPWNGQVKDVETVEQRLRRLRHEPAPKPYAYADPSERRPCEKIEGDFILVALQSEADVNMEDVPKRLRKPQALVDAIVKTCPPWRLVVKQHPSSLALESHAAVEMRRPFDRLWLHEEGGIHHLLRQGGCRCVVALNSNALHDGLLWGVPGIALGKGLWPKSGGPFMASLPKDWEMVDGYRAGSAFIVERYLSWLLSLQWTPGRAGVQGHVQRLLDLLEAPHA